MGKKHSVQAFIDTHTTGISKMCLHLTIRLA